MAYTERFEQIAEHYNGSQRGMSLLDWFAGMALQGDINSSKMGLIGESDSYLKEYASAAYRMAAAMLKARQEVAANG